jgi:hypothetical protein
VQLPVGWADARKPNNAQPTTTEMLGFLRQPNPHATTLVV